MADRHTAWCCDWLTDQPQTAALLWLVIKPSHNPLLLHLKTDLFICLCICPSVHHFERQLFPSHRCLLQLLHQSVLYPRKYWYTSVVPTVQLSISTEVYFWTVHLWWWPGLVVSALVSINEVTLGRARLVLGWVTVFGRVHHLGVSQPPRSTQPSTFRGTVKWVSAFGLSNNNWVGECRPAAA